MRMRFHDDQPETIDATKVTDRWLREGHQRCEYPTNWQQKFDAYVFGRRSPQSFREASQTVLQDPLVDHEYGIPNSQGPIFWEQGTTCYSIINKSKGLALTAIDNGGLKLAGFNSARDQTWFIVSNFHSFTEKVLPRNYCTIER